MRARLVCAILAGCFALAICQTPASPSYDNFFRQVVSEQRAARDGASPGVKLPAPNGQPAALRSYRSEFAGLTDREMNDVRAIAADCETRLSQVGSDHPHFAWEALMASIETGEDKTAEVEQIVRDQQAQRERIVIAHVQVLQAALGDARFQELDARLRAERAEDRGDEDRHGDRSEEAIARRLLTLSHVLVHRADAGFERESGPGVRRPRYGPRDILDLPLPALG